MVLAEGAGADVREAVFACPAWRPADRAIIPKSSIFIRVANSEMSRWSIRIIDGA
jgi:hypothetical protein